MSQLLERSDTSTSADELRALSNRLTAVFLIRGLSDADAADLTQETIARTLAHLRRHGRQRDDISPLANTIAKHLLAEHFRTHGREVPLVAVEHAAGDDDLVDRVAAQERRRSVRDAIDDLPARQRHAMTMLLDGNAPADIAATLGMKRSATDVMLHRARRELATRLERLRDSLWGGVAVLRLTSHRIAHRLGASRMPDLAIAPVIVALGAMVTFSAPIDHAHDADIARTTRVARAATHTTADAARNVTHASTSTTRTSPSGGSASQPPVHVGVRNPSVDVDTSLEQPNGEQAPVETHIDYVPEPQRPGRTGPVVHAATGAVCDNTPAMCGEDQP
jgi:RNA polymerase sigma-70 factor (ECF subfamily)